MQSSQNATLVRASLRLRFCSPSKPVHGCLVTTPSSRRAQLEHGPSRTPVPTLPGRAPRATAPALRPCTSLGVRLSHVQRVTRGPWHHAGTGPARRGNAQEAAQRAASGRVSGWWRSRAPTHGPGAASHCAAVPRGETLRDTARKTGGDRRTRNSRGRTRQPAPARLLQGPGGPRRPEMPLQGFKVATKPF